MIPLPVPEGGWNISKPEPGDFGSYGTVIKAEWDSPFGELQVAVKFLINQASEFTCLTDQISNLFPPEGRLG